MGFLVRGEKLKDWHMLRAKVGLWICPEVISTSSGEREQNEVDGLEPDSTGRPKVMHI